MFVGRTVFASIGLAGPPSPTNPPNPGDPAVPMVINAQSGDFASATLEIIDLDLARIVVTLANQIGPGEVVYVATSRSSTNYVYPSIIASVGVSSETLIELWLSFIPLANEPPGPIPVPPNAIDSNLFNVQLVGFVQPPN